MVKPDIQTLKKLYPDIDSDYLGDNIDRKLMLIKSEDDVILNLRCIMDDFKNQIFFLLNMPYDNSALINAKMKDLEFQIVNLEVDSIAHMYELSGYSYECLIEKYYVSPAEHEIGGEQANSKVTVSRKNVVKRDILNMVQRTISRGRNISSAAGDTLNSLQGDIGRLKPKDNPARYTPVKSAFDKASEELEVATRSVLQQSAYDAERNVNIGVSSGYEVVYYRVEVLDSNICMGCMNIDGSVNGQRLGLLHRNCRGIDVALLRDVNTGKYYDFAMKGYGHKMRRRSFTAKFRDLSEKQKRVMLGKSNYDLYASGKLKPKDFISNGRQITNEEANIIAQLKGLKDSIDTPQKASKLVKYMDSLFASKELSDMSASELLAYEKCLGMQKQIYNNIPDCNFGKKKPKGDYIKSIDVKYNELNKIRQKGVK